MLPRAGLQFRIFLIRTNIRCIGCIVHFKHYAGIGNYNSQIHRMLVAINSVSLNSKSLEVYMPPNPRIKITNLTGTVKGIT